MTGCPGCPCATICVDRAVRRSAARRPSTPQRQRESLCAIGIARCGHRACGGRRRRRPQPLSRPGGVGPCVRTSLRTSPSGRTSPSTPQVWAANGSNEVMHQLFLAFGGPGRTALGFTPTYSMYPEYSQGHLHPLGDGAAGARLRADAGGARDAVLKHRPVITVVPSPNNPTGTALPLETLLALLDATRVTADLSSSTRPMPSSADLVRPRR